MLLGYFWGAYGEAEHHGGRYMVEEVILMTARKKRQE